MYKINLIVIKATIIILYFFLFKQSQSQIQPVWTISSSLIMTFRPMYVNSAWTNTFSLHTSSITSFTNPIIAIGISIQITYQAINQLTINSINNHIGFAVTVTAFSPTSITFKPQVALDSTIVNLKIKYLIVDFDQLGTTISFYFLNATTTVIGTASGTQSNRLSYSGGVTFSVSHQIICLSFLTGFTGNSIDNYQANITCSKATNTQFDYFITTSTQTRITHVSIYFIIVDKTALQIGSEIFIDYGVSKAEWGVQYDSFYPKYAIFTNSFFSGMNSFSIRNNFLFNYTTFNTSFDVSTSSYYADTSNLQIRTRMCVPIPYLLYNKGDGLCYSICPANTVYIPAYSTCQCSNCGVVCPSECISCISNTVQCLQCNKTLGYAWNQFNCYKPCPQSTFLDSNGNNCSNCDPICLSCQNSSNTCIKCKQNFFLHEIENTCLQSCPIFYINQSSNNICIQNKELIILFSLTIFGLILCGIIIAFLLYIIKKKSQNSQQKKRRKKEFNKTLQESLDVYSITIQDLNANIERQQKIEEVRPIDYHNKNFENFEKFQQQDKQMEKQNEKQKQSFIYQICQICQQQCQQDENIFKTNKCTHIFHKTCIDSSFSQNDNKCPICKQSQQQQKQQFQKQYKQQFVNEQDYNKNYTTQIPINNKNNSHNQVQYQYNQIQIKQKQKLKIRDQSQMKNSNQNQNQNQKINQNQNKIQN